MYKSILRPLLFKLSPEKIHNLTFHGLKLYKYIAPLRSTIKHENKCHNYIKLKNTPLKSRVGLAAGFDKAAEVFDELAEFGFGFMEIGTITTHAQLGNPKPRIFRFTKDESLNART